MSRKKNLEVSYAKTCDCPGNTLGCMNAKDWVRSMVGIQEFYYVGRDIRDKNVHPAMFPISLPAHFIKLLTHRGELVIDPFVGAGSTLVAARDLGRNAVGFDLQKKYVEIAKNRLAQNRLCDDCRQIAVVDDANNIPDYLLDATVALSVTSPPYPEFLTHKRLNKSIRADLRKNEYYHQIQQYSDDPRDLGRMSHEAYSDALTGIYKGIFKLTRPKGHCVVNVNDLWKDNRRYPTHMYVVNALTRAGFELRNTIIWDKRNLVNRVGIFGWPNNFISLGATFEYILDFWRPPD